MSDKIDKIIEILKELHKDGAEVLERNKGISLQTYPEEILRWKKYTEEVISSKISIEEAKSFIEKGLDIECDSTGNFYSEEKRSFLEIPVKLVFINTLIGDMRKHPEHWEEKILSSESQKEKLENLRENSNIVFDSLELHLRIKNSSEQLFKDGHYAEAIFNAFRAIEIFVKEKSGIDEGGVRLMSHIFSIKSEDNEITKMPVLKLNELKNESDRNEQDGFHHIFRGVMAGIRNVEGHEEIVQDNPYKTLEYLSLASLLARKIDDSKKSEE